MPQAKNDKLSGISPWLAHNRLILTRIGAALVMVKLLFAGSPPQGFLSVHFAAAHLGLILILLGLFIRSWAAGMIHKNKVLTTTGPYALSRHPLYVGSFLLALGFALIINDAALWIFLAVIMVFVYIPKIGQEEKLMARLFPDEWPVYKEEVTLFYPRRLHLDKLSRPWSGKSWLHHKEYNALAASLAGILVLILWSLYGY